MQTALRSVHFTLGPRDVEACASSALHEAIDLKDRGRKCQASVIWSILLYAAARITSLHDAVIV